MVDLTNLPRVGFRGIDTAEFLLDHGFELPQTPNTLITQQDGSYVARLSATEYLLLGGLDDFGKKIIDLEKTGSWMIVSIICCHVRTAMLVYSLQAHRLL